MSNNKDNMKNKMMKNLGGNFLLWIVIIIVSVSVLQYASLTPKSIEISYAEFTDVYQEQYENISSVIIEDKLLRGECSPTCFGTLSNNEISSFTVVLPELTNDLVNSLVDLGIDVKIKQKTLTFLDYVFQFSPWILILVFWFLIMRRMQGGVGGQSNIFSFAKSKAKVVDSKKTKKMFKDVAGCEEAKTELQEIVDFLKKSDKYHKIGAKIPKGALLLGPPGTGKTLLAKAVAGEANVPFFTISGAEFVEMFVGVGASRVRDLFTQAKTNSPSIIFIDEIDAVGRHRGAGLGGGHDEREQTLNQILVEMDGFDTNTNVILLAATNRPDVLDKALLRPGRFDRQIVVDAPDVIGREQILKIHTKKIPLTKDVKLNVVAQGTPGLVGADLENLVNEAALLAARMNQTKVSMKYFEDAKDKVMMGVERKSMVLTDDDKKITAYHEAGHALVAYFTKLADPVHKITIVPRGRAMGLTAQIPEVERYNYSNQYLLGKLDILMGGRCAEKIIFNNFTTGAGNDISVATDIAKKMVCEWGMSEAVGPMALGKKDQEVFLGKEMSKSNDFSEEKSRLVDNEITSLIKNAEKNATNILKKYLKQLHDVSKVLIERETLDRSQFEDIVENGISENLGKEPVKKRVRRKSVKN
tara:strand:+ start:703 stop:2628 length:1926 start_codon:yes stop_codon:yes gene_type:complete